MSGNMAEKAAQNFVEAYEAARTALPGADGWLARRRAAAIESFAGAGLPHRRLEEWKYTDLRQTLDKAGFASAPEHMGAVVLPEAAAASAFSTLDRYVLVFVNGRFRADLSKAARLPKGVELHGLADVLTEQWAKDLIERRFDEARQAEEIVDLNTALMNDGMCLRIRKGVKLDKPVHLLFLAADGGASHTRNLILLEEEAEGTVLESHIGEAASFADIVTDVALGDGAKLDHVKLQDESADAVHLATLRGEIGAGARLSSFTLTLGCGVSRGQSFIRFAGEGAEAHVNGAYALRAKQHADQFCVVDHAVPRCASNTVFKGVLDGQSEGVFQGKVIVRPDAQKTDGRQMTQALLLSRDAAMNAKPELEIYADDVQCAHGSTVGELSKDALFYLRSRGIPEAEARRLLVLAFLDDVITLAPHEEVRDILRGLVSGWFEEAST
ncbi:Fe-S cluster assembly protein SufD [Parvibaculum sp.]|jgi:Fe-S cluster assembly protein SufD|uniref:Fe-S cluster assembly protein SufD n=1 Tax=Parvibaculum sp. TaxID=2024848 RepID=UPI001B279C8A|nr:Fe-S cluster assembly protein SufD [Parvibaculum sp.]MBO6636126.1 Fe-S cluster assembly protein SufD [Parvibaculum sp.]MBO6678997.1 Fe-S cluster assembly protein SufD [Parvibaculum sp.]MBO6686389.1 Fe-S cluster assembly protein SufD [Parvibaculum sp.]MBO6905946.1 Fe-S cluster assembly protein SufD [Parvibaculum sp.]